MQIYPNFLEWASACTSPDFGDCEITEIHRTVVTGRLDNVLLLECSISDPYGNPLAGITWFEFNVLDGLLYECPTPTLDS